MQKIFVNKEACIGCGACVAIDPEHFDFDEGGQSEVINQENIESDNVKNAMASCPTSAIKLVDSTSDAEEDNCQCDSCECNNCQCEV